MTEQERAQIEFMNIVKRTQGYQSTQWADQDTYYFVSFYEEQTEIPIPNSSLIEHEVTPNQGLAVPDQPEVVEFFRFYMTLRKI